MEFKIKKVYVFGALIGIFLIIFLLGRLSTHRERLIADRILSAAEDTINQYEATINNQKKQVTELSQIVTTKEQAIELGLIEKDKWKKLYYKTIESNTELSAQVSILIDSIKAIKPQIIYITNDPEVDSIPCVVIPYDWVFVDKYVKAVGHVDRQAQTTLNLEMPVEFDVVIGNKKKGNVPAVTILESNPYLYVTGIKSVKVVDNKWYNNRWLPFIAGFGGATAIFFLLK